MPVLQQDVFGAEASVAQQIFLWAYRPENFKTEKNRAGQGSCHRQSDGDTQNCQRRGRGYKTCRSRHKSKPTHQQEKEKDRRANSVCYIQRIDGRERPCASTHVSERIGPKIIFLLRFLLCFLFLLRFQFSSLPSSLSCFSSFLL